MQVSQYYHPYIGGQEAYVRQLSLRMAERGHRVTVLTTSAGANAPDSHPNVSVVRRPAHLAPLNNPISLLGLRESELVRSGDIIHLHNEYSFLTASISVMKRFLDAPTVLTLHGDLRFGTKPLDAFAWMYSRVAGDKILRQSDLVFVNSTEARDSTIYRGVPPERVVVVSNAIDPASLKRYVDPKAASDVRDQLGIPSDHTLILFVGRFIPRKGVDNLLQAFRTFLRTFPEASLLMIGDGPLRGNIEAVMSGSLGEHVLIRSNVPDEFVYRAYQAADLFVLPSLSEVCPTVILEALFFGCRVIASEIAGIRDTVGQWVTLVPVNDVQALSRAILGAIRGSLEGSPGEARREAIESRFNWNVVADRYLTAFEKLWGSGAPPDSDFATPHSPDS